MRTVEECYTYVINRRNELVAQRHKRRMVVLRTLPVCGLSVIAGCFLVTRNNMTDIDMSSYFVEGSTTGFENTPESICFVDGTTASVEKTPNDVLLPSSSMITENHTLSETDGMGIFYFGFTDVDDYPDFSIVSGGLQSNSFIDGDELCEYYGVEKLVANLASAGFVEDTTSDTTYGISTFSDGSIMDYNTLCFSSSRSGMKIKINIGKNFEFGDNYYEEFNESEIGDTKVYIYRCTDEDVYFAIFKYKDCSMMVSAKASTIDVDTTRSEGWLFFNILSTMLDGKCGLGTGGDTPS